MEKANPMDFSSASVGKTGLITEAVHVRGKYWAKAYGPKEELREKYLTLKMEIQQMIDAGREWLTGPLKELARSMLELKWEAEAPNVVTFIGRNLILDTVLAGSGYSATGPFMGLISSVGYGAGPVIGDTMGSHGGWTEAGSGVNYPLIGGAGTRITTNGGWNGAASNVGGGYSTKSVATSLVFTIGATGGNVKGCFLVLGAGAVSTIGSGAGSLYSTGLFTGGDKTGLGPGDTLSVGYTGQA